MKKITAILPILLLLIIAACGKKETKISDFSNPDIQARRDSIGDVGYEGNINYELLMSLYPDLVLLYGVNGASSMEGKLKELGIPYMYVGEYLEESPLGKAEWLVALSEVADKRAGGEKAFAGIPERYNDLKMRVLASSQMGPKVMLNTPYGDSWFMPSTESYVAQLIKDAGGNDYYESGVVNPYLVLRDLINIFQPLLS